MAVVLALVLLAALPPWPTAAPVAQEPQPAAGELQLADGPYSELRMLYRRTIFRVRVLELSLRVDRAARDRIREIAAGESYAEEAASRIADAILESRQVLVQTVFLRNVSHGRFVDELIAGARCALEAGIIGQPEFQRVSDHSADWYAPIRERGIRTGDRAIYQIRGDSMRSTLQSEDGEVFVDQVDRGPGPRRSLLGGYLALCSDFREPLIRSLFP
jgi:hypothetical protein